MEDVGREGNAAAEVEPGRASKAVRKQVVYFKLYDALSQVEAPIYIYIYIHTLSHKRTLLCFSIGFFMKLFRASWA